jgi:endoglucanase
VNAIRNAGATNHKIILPGTDYANAWSLINAATAGRLDTITNPDSSVDNLVFDIHQYLDSDRSGTHAECVTNNIKEAFGPLAKWLRDNGRTAIVTETGGGPNAESCMRRLCEQLEFLK